MSEKSGLVFKDMVAEDDALGREFMEAPEKFAASRAIRDVECPPEVHEALARGTTLAEAIKAGGFRPDSDSMNGLKDLVARHFGEDYEVSLIPFGLKFREKINSAGLDWTATGSGTITWLDTDSDVDS